jgi:hypothetical protein
MPLVANDGAWPNKGVSMQTTILSLIAILLLAPVGCSRASGEEAADRSLQLEDPMLLSYITTRCRRRYGGFALISTKGPSGRMPTFSEGQRSILS